MIHSIQKIIKVGSSAAITLPAKDLKHENLAIGQDVEVFVRSVPKHQTASDQSVLETAQKILDAYRQDFENLAKR